MFSLVLDAEKCVGCGACADCCPFSAVTMTGGQPSFDGRCHMCLACVDTCPAGAITAP